MNIVKSSLTVLAISTSLFISGCLPRDSAPDAAFNNGYWNKSIELYKEAIPKTKNNAKAAQMTYNTAYSYFQTKDYKQAAVWFEKSIEAKYAEAHPEAILYLAESYKASCDYDNAIKKFNEYKERMPNDKRAVNGAKSCELALEWQKNPTRYKVENVVLLNTANDDAAPAYANKTNKAIVFYSYREGGTGKGVSDILGQDFPDLYTAELDKKGKWSIPALVKGEGVNTEFAEGAPTFDQKYNTLYYSRCGENKMTGCQILWAKKNGDAYSVPAVIPIAADSFAVAHPALSVDNQTLYFSSNIPGGYGGKDLWYMTYNKKENTWEKPTNLGPEVNTSADEIFPYIHIDGTLYFSSNGHIGIGGFDLFKAAKTQDGFGPIINLKVPLNSCSDDIAIAFEDKAERGYITSNREGGKGKLDIWSFVLPRLEFALKGKVYEEGTTIVIPGSKVYLVGSDGSQAETVTDSLGGYGFPLMPNVTYEVSAVSDKVYGDEDPLKKGRKIYFSSKTSSLVSTVGMEESKTFEQDIPLIRIPIKLELPNIEYEYNKADLTPKSKIVLNTFIKETLIPNPTMSIEMGSHTDFRGTANYNRNLAQKRAESAIRYLIEQGVDPNRLKAKGYGEDQPKLITKENIQFVTKGYEADFPIGTLLDEKFINALKSKDLQEVAHQMNRRTEFKFLCTDWVPGQTADACLK